MGIFSRKKKSKPSHSSSQAIATSLSGPSNSNFPAVAAPLSVPSNSSPPAVIVPQSFQPSHFCKPCNDALLYLHGHPYPGWSNVTLWQTVFQELGAGYAPCESRLWFNSSCGLCSLFASQEHARHVNRLEEFSSDGDHFVVWRLDNIQGPGGSIGQLKLEVWDLDQAQRVSFGPRWVSHFITLQRRSHSPPFQVPSLGDSTRHQKTFDTIAGWLNHCNMNHKDCHKLVSANSGWRPLRLLDLRALSKEPQDRELVRISDRSVSSEGVSYASLSYCWGNEDQRRHLKLTKSHLEKWTKYGIEFNQFPQTMQGAILATRKLNVDFLWIDSVCLVQHKPQWAIEAAEMQKVYGAAVFNIVADISQHHDYGLFLQRVPDSIEFRGCNWETEYLSSSGAREHVQIHLSQGDPWELLNKQSCTNNRAWIFQEELLSARRIHFGGTQVFWQCAEGNYCETYPQGRILSGTSPDLLKREFDGLRLGKPGTTRQMNELRRPNDNSAFELLWSFAVQSYTSRGISFATDRLVAPSGVAAEFAKLRPKNRYLAGLWRHNLEWFLCWTAEQGQLRRIEEAPSWSWGNVAGAVRMDVVTGAVNEDQHTGPGSSSSPLYHVYNSMVKIQDARTDLCNPSDLTGRALSGTINLWGYLLKVEYRLHYSAPGSPARMLVGADRDETFYSSEKAYKCTLDDPGPIEGTVYFLPILATAHPIFRIKGLLVQELDRNKRKGAFKRIGYLATSRQWRDVPGFLLTNEKPSKVDPRIVLKLGNDGDCLLDLV